MTSAGETTETTVALAKKKGPVDSAASEAQAKSIEVLRALEEAGGSTPHEVAQRVLWGTTSTLMALAMIQGTSLTFFVFLTQSWSTGAYFLLAPVVAFHLAGALRSGATLLRAELLHTEEGRSRSLSLKSGGLDYAALLTIGGAGSLLGLGCQVLLDLATSAEVLGAAWALQVASVGVLAFAVFSQAHVIGRLVYGGDDPEAAFYEGNQEALQALNPFYQPGRRTWRRGIQLAFRLASRGAVYALITTTLAAALGVTLAPTSVAGFVVTFLGLTFFSHWTHVAALYWYAGYLSGRGAEFAALTSARESNSQLSAYPGSREG